MWIEPTPNGKFKACERYTDPMSGKTKKASITIEKDIRSSKKEIKKIEEALNAKIAALQQTNNSKPELTLQELKDRYIKSQKAAGLEESTYARNDRVLSSVLKLLGSDTLINKLTARYIMVKLTDADITNTRRNTYLTRLKAMLRWGYQYDYIDSVEYLNKIKRFSEESAREKVAEKYLEPNETNTLLEGMKIQRWKLLTQFLVLSGLRIGEAMALTKDDITNDMIIVNKTADIVNGYVKDRTKTDTSTREVYIQPELADVIKQIKVFNLKNQLKYSYKTNLFISGNDGDIIPYAGYCKYLRENSEKYLGRRITPHALRHTHVSLLAAQGMSLDAIARRVGHEDSEITRKIYFHITKDLKEKDKQEIMRIKLL